jgi:acylglycerol lipase
MPHEEGHIQAGDGLALHENRWLPDGDAVAIVVVVHGFVEHGGRYAELAAELNRRGYAVYAMDHRGHGKSEGERVLVGSFDEYLDDLERYLDCVREREPGEPVFLYGFSMGGTIVGLLAAMHRLDVRGIVLAGAAVQVAGRVFPVLRRLAGLLSLLCPRLRLVRVRLRNISRDPEVVAQVESDPLVFHGRIPSRTGAEILRAAHRLRSQLGEIELPLLVLHGTGDLLTDPEGSRELYARAKSADKTLRLYEGVHHDLLHEPEKCQVTADLIEWLDARK